MDYIIDLCNICKNNYESNSISYSLTFYSSALKDNFGKKCLVSSSILLNLYSVLFSLKNIDIENMPDNEQIIKDLSKRGQNNFCLSEYLKNTKPLTATKINDALNNSKIELNNYLNQLKNYISKFSKKISFINHSPSKSVDKDELFYSLRILPFIKNDFFLNILSRYGLLNIS